jgi:hypothetical protein
MVVRSCTILKGKNGLYTRYEFGEVTVSNADTFVLSNFSATANLWNVYMMKKSDGSEMTQTHAATYTVTITGAGTDVPCYYMVYGIKA